MVSRRTRCCGSEASEVIPFPGADSIFSSRCGAISGRLPFCLRALSRHDPGDRNASVQKIDNRLGNLRRDGLGSWSTSAGSNFPLERRAKATRETMASITARRLSAGFRSPQRFPRLRLQRHVFPQIAFAVVHQALAVDPNPTRGIASFSAPRGVRGASRARAGGPESLKRHPGTLAQIVFFRKKYRQENRRCRFGAKSRSGIARPPRERKKCSVALLDCTKLGSLLVRRRPNNYRSNRVSDAPAVIARSPCDEAIQGPQHARRQQPRRSYCDRWIASLRSQ